MQARADGANRAPQDFCCLRVTHFLKFAKDNDNDLVVTTNMTKETLQATPAYAKPKQ